MNQLFKYMIASFYLFKLTEEISDSVFSAMLTIMNDMQDQQHFGTDECLREWIDMHGERNTKIALAKLDEMYQRITEKQ